MFESLAESFEMFQFHCPPGDVALHHGVDHGQMGEAFSGHLEMGVL